MFCAVRPTIAYSNCEHTEFNGEPKYDLYKHTYKHKYVAQSLTSRETHPIYNINSIQLT